MEQILISFVRRIIHKRCVQYYQISCQYSTEGSTRIDYDGRYERKRFSRFKFMDSLRIYAKGGSGGQGIPYRGGVGGVGGDVVVEGKKGFTLTKVLRQNSTKRFKGDKGGNSRLFCLLGEDAPPTIIKVPLGITVKSDEGHILGEINEEGDKVVIARGGAGASEFNGFVGQKGEINLVKLDLKLIADVGFVGFPNAGKSSLLRAISNAKPRVAAFPFTTIRPHIGIVDFTDERRISLADLPGLIEGAHANYGMGHNFLKHIERTKLLLFVVDLQGFQLSHKYQHRTALETIILLNREVEIYRSDLVEKPAILALNKTDLPGSFKILQDVRDVYGDENKLLEAIDSLPEACRPENIIRFDCIVGISATNDRQSVNILKDHIRKVIDVNDEIMLKKFDE